MPCFRVFRLFRGSLIFGDMNQSVVAGLGFFNHGIHRTHGRESLHGHASFPCIRVVPWFPDFRGQVLIPCQYSRVAARLEMATGKSKVYKLLGSEDAIDCRKRRSTRLRHCRTLAGVISNNFATSSVDC